MKKIQIVNKRSKNMITEFKYFFFLQCFKMLICINIIKLLVQFNL